MADLLKYALIGVGGYLVYKFVTAPAAAAPAGTPPATGGGTPPAAGGGTPPAPPPAPPPTAYVPPTTLQQLQNAAGGASVKLNADQWHYYWTNTLKKPALSDDVFTALFFPNGRPADPTQAPTFTADVFLSGLTSKGISGLGARRVFAGRVPVVAIPRGRNYVRPGSPMRRIG